MEHRVEKIGFFLVYVRMLFVTGKMRVWKSPGKEVVGFNDEGLRLSEIIPSIIVLVTLPLKLLSRGVFLFALRLAHLMLSSLTLIILSNSN